MSAYRRKSELHPHQRLTVGFNKRAVRAPQARELASEG